MIIGKYKTLDAKRLKPIIDEYLPATEAFYHKSGTHQQMMIGNKDWSKNNFWADRMDLYNYIEKNVYPENVPIDNTWCKLYTTETKVGPTNQGEFIGLHQDREYEWPPDDSQLIHTTSILLHRSEDAIGGYSVLAGDHQLQQPKENRFKDTRDIMSRLVVENLTEPGESITWNGWTMHGVSEMQQGSRLSFVVFKKTPFNEDYFKSG
jgi:hypothetical protein